MIPVNKILSEDVGEGEFNFREGRPIMVRFANVSDSWPKAWVLNSIQMFEVNQPAQGIELKGSELKERLAEPKVLRFK
jgi:hypothetical protein